MKSKSNKNDYDWTTNRNYYNKLRKHYLEGVGEIRCSWCGYNKGENSNHEWYGGFDSIDNVKIPNWKLVSKKRKQWMKKPKNYKIVEKGHPWRSNHIYYEVKW